MFAKGMPREDAKATPPGCSSVRIFCLQLLFGIFLMQEPTRELQKPIHATCH